MPPPWSSSPLLARNITDTSTSAWLLLSRMHRLKTGRGLVPVCDRTYPFFDGALSSASTFQLPLPFFPVWSAFQPAGTLFRLSFENVTVRVFLSSAAPIRTAATRAKVIRIVLPPGPEPREISDYSPSRGRATVNVDPSPGALVTVISPP